MKAHSPSSMLAGIIMLAVSSPLFGRQDGEFLKGYVITNKYDTIHGWILLKDHLYNINTCSFRSSPEGVVRNYTPEEIMAYSIDDKKYFYSHEIARNSSVVESFKGQKVFLECLVKGSVSLYFFEGRYFMQTPESIKELTRSETQVVNDGKKYVSRQPEYKFTLRQAMGNCIFVDQYLETATFTKHNLSRVFIKYHECTGGSSLAFETSREAERIRTGFSLAPGLNFSSMSITAGGSAEYEFIKTTRPSKAHSLAVSFYVNIFRPGVTTRQELKIGLSVYSGRYHFMSENEVTNLSYDLSVNSATVEIPVLLKRYLLRRRASLYLQGGVGLNTPVKWEDKIRVSVLTSSSVLRESEDDLTPNPVAVNFLLGPGVNLPIGGRDFLFESMFTYNPALLKGSANGPSSTVSAITLNAGMKF